MLQILGVQDTMVEKVYARKGCRSKSAAEEIKEGNGQLLIEHVELESNR